MIHANDEVDLARDEAQLIDKSKREFWFWAFNGLLFVHDYDLNGVYKTEQQQNQGTSGKYQLRSLYQAPELQLVRTKQDAHRHWCTRPLRLFVCYFFIKALIISMGQYTILHYEHLVPQGHRAPLLSRPTTELILQTLGNPLYVLRDFAVIFYAFPVGLCVLGFILLPQRYQRKPLNVAALRFLQSPGQELKRIDLNIERKLYDLRSSLGVYWHQKRNEIIRQSRATAEAGKKLRHRYQDNRKFHQRLNELLQVEEIYCSQLSEFLVQLSPALKQPSSRAYGSLRPITYEPKYFFDTTEKLSAKLLVLNSIYLMCLCLVIVTMEVTPFNYKCRAYRQNYPELINPDDYCNPFRIFTLAELLVLIELPVLMMATSLVSMLNLSMHTMAMENQLLLIEGIQRELVNCKNSILQYEHYYMNSFRTHVPTFQINGEAEEKKSGCLWQPLEHRLRLDKFLLQLLVRLSVCENELRDNSESISELSLHVMYYAFGVTTYAVIGGHLKLPDTIYIRQFIVLFSLINFNIVAIACAHVYARIVQFERTMWLVLAAIASTFVSNDPITSYKFDYKNKEEEEDDDRRPRSCTLARDLWIKFVTATSTNIECYCARPLAVKLTYEMIIELNFFVVFAYSLSIGYH